MSNIINPIAEEKPEASLSQELIKNQNEKKRLVFKKKFLELIETSTSHGLPNIVRTNRLSIKILWTICLLAAIGGCSYMVFKSISDYYEHDTVTKIEKITEPKSRFPTVSICNRDPLTTLVAQNFIENFAFTDFNVNLSTVDKFPDLIQNIIQANRKTLLYAFTDKIDKKLLGSYPEISRCSFNDKECSLNDFEFYYNIDLGNCIRFNSGKNWTGSAKPFLENDKTGQKYGLSLILFSANLENLYSATFSEGLRIFIHNESITPANSEGIDIQPSKQTSIEVKRTFIQKEPDPYSDCVNLDNTDSYLYKFIINTNKTYRQKDCFELCLQERIINRCKCYDLNYGKLFDVEPCLSHAQFDCSAKESELFLSSEVDDRCLSLCPLECESVEYNFFASFGDFPTENFCSLFIKYYKNLLNYQLGINLSDSEWRDYLKRKSLAIDIYYSEIGYTKISESPKTSIIDLFSNVGGTLGLFVGVSMLSLIEIVEILFELVIIKFNL